MCSKIKIIDYESSDSGKQLEDSLHNTGFALLQNHNLDHNLIMSVYKEWGIFFESDVKHSYIFDPESQDGYFPYRCENAKGYPTKDLKEFYHFYQWGKHPESITKNSLILFNQLLDIGKELLGWIDNHTPDNIKSKFSMPLAEMIENSPMNLLRIIHYPPLNGKFIDGSIRAEAHGDINLITLLHAGTQPGLQVKNADNKWTNVECNPDWIVINTGDMLHECSGGYYPSTIHRVINPIGDNTKLPRYTMPFFIHPRDEVVLSDRYIARQFLDERLMEIGLIKG